MTRGNRVEMPVRGPNCPPALELESLFAGEAVPEQTSSHASTCGQCGAYLASLTRAQHTFLAERPVELFQMKLKRASQDRQRSTPWLRWNWIAVPVVAVLLVVGLRSATRAWTEDRRTKGTALSVFYKRNGMKSPERVLHDARLKKGDLLRFAYAAPEPGHLIILDLDATRRVTVFHPFGGTEAAKIDTLNAGALLPGTVALDDAPGSEWIVAIFSPNPLDIQRLQEDLASTMPGGVPRLACMGCQVTSLRLQKEP